MECPSCKFVAAPGQVAEDGICPNCERPYAHQPTPLNSEMEMRNMVSPGEGDMGGNPLQEGILGDYQNRGVRDESYASVQKVGACPTCGGYPEDYALGPSGQGPINECPTCNGTGQDPDFEVTGVLPPDPRSLLPDNKRTTMKHEAFLPLLGLLAGGSALLGGEGLAGAATAMAPSIAGSLIGHSLSNSILPGATAGAQQATQGQQSVQGPDYYSSTDAPFTHFFGADEALKSPGSNDRIMGDEDNDYDTKETNDGDRELGLHVGPGVNDIGGTDQGFSDEAKQSITGLLPKILQFALTGESGAGDPELTGLDQQLEGEMPGYKDQADDGAAHKFVMMILKGNGDQPGGDEEGDGLKDNDAPHDPISEKASNLNVCPSCHGALDPSTSRCPQCASGNVLGGPQPVNTNQPPHIAADTQGPKTPEQQSAVAQMLLDENRSDEIPLMLQNPQDYADELAQITQQDTPPQGPSPDDQPPPTPEAPPQAGMPMPGMQAPGPSAMGQPGMMASIVSSQVDGLAGKCPKCDGHSTGYLNEDGDCGCKSCGHEWKDDKIVGDGQRTADEHVQQHGDNFDNSIGVDAADVRHQENPEMEQDSSHTWMDDQHEPLKVGSEYEMYSDKYDIPDLIRIEAVKPDSIEYTLTGEYGIEHRTEITHEEAQLENLHFVPAHDGGAELEDPGLDQNQDDIQRPGTGFEQTDLSQPHMQMSHTHTAAMSAQDFRLLADAIRSAPAENKLALAEHFANALGNTNPMFDAERFMAAATGNPGPRDAYNPAGGDAPPVVAPGEQTTLAATKEADDYTGTQPMPAQDYPQLGFGYDAYDQCRACGGRVRDGICEGCGAYHDPQAAVENPLDPMVASVGTGPDWLMDGVHTAGAKFTPTEQRDFIEEVGVARNADKLNLAGTHYESRADSIDDEQFLFGI